MSYARARTRKPAPRRRDDIMAQAHIQMAGGDLQRAVRYGHPTVGWEGDPHLTVVFNHLTEMWEVWDEHPSVKPYIVAMKRGDSRLNINSLCRRLSRNSFAKRDPVERFEELYADVERQQQREDDAAADKLAEVHEKLYWAVARDEGEPGVRIY